MADLDDRTVDPAVLSLALRNESAVLIAARTISHTTAAHRLGISKQTQSDWMREHLRRTCKVLGAYGLKVVPKDDQTYSAADMAALGRIARKGLDALIPAVAEARLNGGGVVEDELPTIPGSLHD